MDKELKSLIDNHASETEFAAYAAKHADNPFNVLELEKGDIIKVLNGTYLAKRFFGKSTSWFNQKLNNTVKKGKICEFTPQERKILKDALSTISWELQILSDDM